ncbi:MAG: hypothetical protein K2K57_08115 [Oscillospiraceae bacterium]|nr:hypothetical protein [Oscillospiraceae bacterium]
MIKGVNKRIVEVRLPESAYFERALVFLRSDLPVSDSEASTAAIAEGDIAAAAMKDITLLESGLPCANEPVTFAGKFLRCFLRIGVFAASLFRLLWHASVIVCAVGIVYMLFDMR